MSSTPTTINLLTRDGAVTVTFEPALEPSQYDELFAAAHAINTEEGLAKMLREMAERWERNIIIDPC